MEMPVLPKVKKALIDTTAGKDETSFKRHHDTLKNGIKRSPNHQMVSQLMKLTFPQRRQKIITTLQTIAEILSEWPFLSFFDHVWLFSLSALIL